MTKHLKCDLLVGAHTSAGGGAPNALYQGAEIGATAIQFFTSNQKQWKGRIISLDEVALFEKAKKETGINVTMCHDSYLINLGATNPEILEKSLLAFEEEIKRCHLLHVDYLNFHPGAHTTGTKEASLDLIVKSLLSFEKLAKEGSTRLLIEATAGQGTSIGSTFEELAYLIERTHKKLPMGICIDTCHIFAAGYDLRTKEAVYKTIEEFDRVIGLEHLFAFHLNDSKFALGSRKDRHEELGKGEIGMECFKTIMQHPKLKNTLKILETPNPDIWDDEIKLLISFTKG